MNQDVGIVLQSDGKHVAVPAEMLHLSCFAVVGGCEVNTLRMIEACPSSRHHVVVLGSPGPMTSRWQEAGARVDHLDILKSNPIQFFFALKRWGLAQSGPLRQIIYWSSTRLPWVLAALNQSNTRWVIHLGNPFPTSMMRRIQWRAYEWLIRPQWAVGFAACSQAVATSHRSAPFFRRLPIAVIPNPVQTQPAVEYRSISRETSVRIGMVARLDRIKDHDTILRALPAILEAFPHVRLEFAGTGERMEHLRGLARELGVADKVDFLGQVSDVPGRLSQWDLFMYATTTREGLGNAVAEALMAGLPCIVSDLPVMHEVCGEGNAVFCASRDASAFAKAACHLLEDLELRRKLGQAGRKWALRQFDPASCAKAYMGMLGVESNAQL